MSRAGVQAGAIRTESTWRGDDGFTLVELLIALAIIGGAVLLAAPMTRTSLAPRLLAETASDFAAMARSTRAAAIRSGAERVLVVDLASRSYWADGVSGPRSVPAHLGFDMAVAGEPATGSRRVVRFLANGGSSGGRLMLRDGGRMLAVEIDWLTGGARVAKATP